MKTSFQLSSLLKSMAFFLCLLLVSQGVGASDRRPLLEDYSDLSSADSFSSPLPEIRFVSVHPDAALRQSRVGGVGLPISISGGGASLASRFGGSSSVLMTPPPSNVAAMARQIVFSPVREVPRVEGLEGSGLVGDHVVVDMTPGYGPIVAPLLEKTETIETASAIKKLNIFVKKSYKGGFLKSFFSSEEGRGLLREFIDFLATSEGERFSSFLSSGAERSLADFCESHEGAAFADFLKKVAPFLKSFSERTSSEEHGIVVSKIIEIYLKGLSGKTKQLQSNLSGFLDSLAPILSTGDAKNPDTLQNILMQKLARLEALEREHADTKGELEVTKASLAQERARADAADLRATQSQTLTNTPAQAAARLRESRVRAPEVHDVEAQTVAPQSQIQVGNRCINFIKAWGGWCLAAGIGGVLIWLKSTGKISI